MPLDRKKIGYAGKMNEHILRYFEPKSITVLSVEKKLIIKSDNMNRNIPDTIIIKKEYFIDKEVLKEKQEMVVNQGKAK